MNRTQILVITLSNHKIHICYLGTQYFFRQYKRITYYTIQNFGWREGLMLVLTGFTGGIFTAIAGSGVDICSFSVLTLLFRLKFCNNILCCRAVVVTQLSERSLPTPEVCSSNPVIGELLYRIFVYCQLYWKDEKKKKRPGMAQLKKHFML